MLALTLIQPWATAIIHFGKDVENRPWAPWPKLKPGMRFAIHAGKKLDPEAVAWMLEQFGPRPWAYPRGALLGTVELAGFVEGYAGYTWHAITEEEARAAQRSRWRNHEAPFAWVLRNPRPLATPIPCPGALGLWRVPAEHLAALEAA